MSKNEKLKTGFQEFIDWYKAPVRLVERPLQLLFKLQELEAPVHWEYERRPRWFIRLRRYMWRVFKVLYFFLLFIPLAAIGFGIYVVAWIWPVFFGEFLVFLLGFLNSLLEKIGSQ